MNRERKIRSILIRFLVAGTIFLTVVFMRFLPFCADIMEKILRYLVTDIVFLR